MTSKQIMDKINKKKGQFFKVSFRRKNNKYEGKTLVHRAGEIREMLCRRGVHKFVTGKSSNKASDIKNNVLTVFDVQTYNTLRKSLGNKKAGEASYRRIPLNNVITIQ